jgi:two-component system, cell cycle response regulator DivK
MALIAVVEDNPDNRSLVRMLLQDDYDLVEYGDGPDALAGLRDTLPDLVLLDISLPGMDGTEVLAQVRADASLRALPVVAITAHAMQGDRERYLAMGFDGYVSKPLVDESLLYQAIQGLLAP